MRRVSAFLGKLLLAGALAMFLTGLFASRLAFAASADDISTFHHAVATGDVPKVAEMLKREPRLATSRGEFGFQPMTLQDTYFEPEIFRMLIAAGADVNAANDDGITLLHIISDPDAVPLIVAAGGNLEARDKKGRTPLLLDMTEPDREDVIEALIDAGANVNAKDTAGETALSMARKDHDASLENLLIRSGARQ